MRFFSSAVVFSLVVLSSYGCRKRTFSDAKSGEAVSAGAEAGSSSEAARVQEIENATDFLLASIEKSPMLQPRYKDGTRIEGGWVSPAGKELGMAQKVFYCAVPLEVRLCNTPDLRELKKRLEKGDLSVPDYATQATEAFVACQKKVDEMLGDDGTFLYPVEVNAVYRSVFIERKEALSDDALAKLEEKYRPTITERSFPELFALSFKDIRAQLEDFEKEKKGLPRWEARIFSFKTLLGLILDKRDESIL